MSDQASVAAIQQRQAALARRHSAATEADRALTEAVASAYEEMRASVRRLDAIAAEIERGRELATDTPLGAREFQRFLLSKQREIAAIVTAAREFSHAKSTVLQSLRDQYSG